MDGYLNQSDVCRRLGISNARLKYHQYRGLIPMPTHQVGDRYYYLPSEFNGIYTAWTTRKRKPRAKRGAK